ncbi:hypothetical protein RRG08_064462 [Elysia crispata]|uniref:Uncharacterized protein n=1 Tax=Elysia crispata TaxID=231223 RepID=A0AAE0Y127_9GAST|nr:hypothetical protein RRG08_064462 [Elysia crispata]
MLNYELRISQLEDYMKDECNEAPIREIVQEELKSGEESRNSDNEGSSEELKNISISNDLTKNEREQEAALRNEAKRLHEAPRDCQCKVWGPPWARKIVKAIKEQ